MRESIWSSETDRVCLIHSRSWTDDDWLGLERRYALHRLLLALIGVVLVLGNCKVFREIFEERTLLLLNLLMSDLLLEHLDLSLFFLLQFLLPLLFVGKNLFLLIQLFLLL